MYSVESGSSTCSILLWLKVQDDFRFGFDKNKNSIDSGNRGGLEEKVSQIIAHAISNAALNIPNSEALLSELLGRLSGESFMTGICEV